MSNPSWSTILVLRKTQLRESPHLHLDLDVGYLRSGEHKKWELHVEIPIDGRLDRTSEVSFNK